MATAIAVLKIIALAVTILGPLLSRRFRTGLTGWVRR